MKRTFPLLFLLMPIMLLGQKDSLNLKVQKPIAMIYGKSKGSISRGDILKAGELTLKGDGTKGCQVEGFSMSLHYKWNPNCDTGSQPPFLKSNSNRLTKRMINLIKPKVDYSKCFTIYLTFFNIIWGSADRTVHKLDDITFILTN